MIIRLNTGNRHDALFLHYCKVLLDREIYLPKSHVELLIIMTDWKTRDIITKRCIKGRVFCSEQVVWNMMSQFKKYGLIYKTGVNFIEVADWLLPNKRLQEHG